MIACSPEELSAILREDLVTFAAKCFDTLTPNHPMSSAWYVQHIMHELLECQNGKRPRLLVSIPPRFGKSTLISVIYSAWRLGHDPSLKILCASYGEDLTNENSSKFRTIIESDWYQKLFPKFEISPYKSSIREVKTTAGGGRLASSIYGSITGFGATLIIFDDLMKGDDAYSETKRAAIMSVLQNTALSRLDNADNSSIIVVGQRLHPQDPIGCLLETGNWKYLCLPAIATEPGTFRLARHNGYVEHVRKVGDLLDPERWSQGALDAKKADVGTAIFNAQYQQQPEAISDSYVRWEWFKSYNDAPEVDFVFMSVDPASAVNSNADWSVCIVFGVLGDDTYQLHVERRRLGTTDLVTRITQLGQQYRADAILVESANTGVVIIEELRKRQNAKVWAVKPIHSKKSRLLEIVPKIEFGHVYLPRNAIWRPDFKQEILSFPNGKYDDQVDAFSQFFGNRELLIARTRPFRIHSVGRPLYHSYDRHLPKVYVRV